jgi:ankyrin repeat protein
LFCSHTADLGIADLQGETSLLLCLQLIQKTTHDLTLFFQLLTRARESQPQVLQCINKKRENLLHVAVLRGDEFVPVLEQLLLAGVDLQVRNAEGHTALDLALLLKHTAAIEKLTHPPKLFLAATSPSPPFKNNNNHNNNNNNNNNNAALLSDEEVRKYLLPFLSEI